MVLEKGNKMKKWLNHYIDEAGTWRPGQVLYKKGSKSVDLSGANVCLHETAVGGSVVLSPKDRHLTCNGQPEVYLKITYADHWDYLSAPLKTPVDVDNVRNLELNILYPLGDNQSTEVGYRALVNAHCVYEINNALDDWLVANPSIANTIQWEDAGGFRALTNWTPTEREGLREAYRLAEQGSSLTLADPPANQQVLGDSDFPMTVLRSEDAWPLFLAHVAHALHLEIGGGLGWSVRNYGDPELAVLFNSKYYFEWDAMRGGYNFSRTRVGAAAAGWPLSRGNSLLAPPKLVYDFLTGNNLITGDRFQTIGRVLEWSRKNLVHFTGGLTAKNVEDQWQYRGLPPVSRILAGTPNDAYPADGVRHRTAGCHGTNGFLKDVLRVVNIPVLYHSPEGTGHATPHFLSEARYLSHGDDPYNIFAQGDPPPYPATELLIDAAQFNAWFGSGVPAAERQNNIGRRVYELALQYLPNYLLHLHCQDLAAGRAHNASSVYDAFKKWYTVADLEAMNLWSRMDDRIAERGGCGNIP
jgi:hypothetical protein